jgi:hypothetical protein
MKARSFLIPRENIAPAIAPRRGYCIASDRITVHGDRVGFLYRESPSDDVDSGWRFFSGTESQHYVDDPNNMTIYDVNTIANYDPDIVPFLDAEYGSAFEREERTGKFGPVPFPEEPDEGPE